MELKICDVSKQFGDKTALDGVSLSASGGIPLGLLGRNGAGKTTLMRIIMNILLPDAGTVTLDGKPISSQPRRLGYLPEERGLYARTPIDEQLCYIARLRGLDRTEAGKACSYWLDRLDMSQYRHAKPQTLSKGSQQRIQLAMALINNPDVIILDEPFSGLDPVNAMQLQSIISDLADEGKIVIISSHQMNTVENLCGRAVMLRSGRIALDSSIRQLRDDNSGSTLRIRTGDDAAALSIIKRFGSPLLTPDGIILTLDDISQKDRLLHELSASQPDIRLFELCSPSLDELFIRICGDAPKAGGEPDE